MAVPVMWRGATANGDDWLLTHRDDGFVLRQRSHNILIPAAESGRISVIRRWWRTTVTIAGVSESLGALAGLTRDEGRRLEEAVREAFARALAAWTDKVGSTIKAARNELRWITEEEMAVLAAARPRLSDAEPSATWGVDGVEALWLSEEDARRWVHTVNHEIAAAIIQSQRRFFDTVESSPLTDEQARAVVAYDNRANVIAAAGSGKTSVMVGRAAYAVHRVLARPEEIVLLAFNKDAARELQDRIQARFSAAGLSADGVVATTFHAFGLKVIGQATRRKPTVAPWVTDNNELTVLSDIVDQLKASDPPIPARLGLVQTPLRAP